MFKLRFYFTNQNLIFGSLDSPIAYKFTSSKLCKASTSSQVFQAAQSRQYKIYIFNLFGALNKK